MANVSGGLISQVLADSDGEKLSSNITGYLVDERVLADSDGERLSSGKGGLDTKSTYSRRLIIVPVDQGD
jgi:hypothetical protein